MAQIFVTPMGDTFFQIVKQLCRIWLGQILPNTYPAQVGRQANSGSSGPGLHPLFLLFRHSNMNIAGSVIQRFLLPPGLQGRSPFRLRRPRLCGYKAYARYTPGHPFGVSRVLRHFPGQVYTISRRICSSAAALKLFISPTQRS